MSELAWLLRVFEDANRTSENENEKENKNDTENEKEI